jgi:FkbM family methyltransferase
MLQPALNRAGLDVRRHPPTPSKSWTETAFHKLRVKQDESRRSEISAEEDFVLFCGAHATSSKSQLFQDIFVQWILDEQRYGYFVEFGATNGIRLSNTFHLERDLHWKGILAEPAKVWHEDLRKSRHCHHIDTRCVWTCDREILHFNEHNDPELSTIELISPNDMHVASRQAGQQYEVETVTLLSLLTQYNAPTAIDYLSIDTEGSEFDILRVFDFSK